MLPSCLCVCRVAQARLLRNHRAQAIEAEADAKQRAAPSPVPVLKKPTAAPAGVLQVRWRLCG